MAVSPSTARKLTEVVVPPSLDSLFGQISTTLDQKETRDVIHELKRLYPRTDFFDQADLHETFQKLYEQGVIDDGGDQKILKILTGKTSKKEEIMKLLCDYEKASPSRKDDFVGRDDDVNNLVELMMDPRVPGVNVFGDLGLGKTTLAIEVSKKLAKNENYVPFIVDLRGTKDINTVYFKVLETFQLTPWDYSKERIYTHLKQDLDTKTLLILDNIEQFLSNENEADKKRKNEFLEFLRTVMSSEASQRGSLKVILTSRKKMDDSMLEDTGFQQKELKPLTEKDSRQLMSRKIKDETAEEDQAALEEIAVLCRNTPYLLERAEQLLRQNFSKPSEVLEKLNTIKNKGVPERFACISALFDSLPRGSDNLRHVSIQISLLQRPFSVSTAMKIAEFSSEYDAQLVLELLATQKIITAKDVNGERKYDLHALFRVFVTSYLCKDPVYEDVYKKAENQFAEHFSKRFIELAKNLDKDFVSTYEELQEDKANIEFLIDLVTRKETLDLIFQSDDVEDTVSVAILFEAFKSIKERRKLFGEWAKIVEKKGNWLFSSYFRCLQSIQLADMEGTQTAWEALKKAEMSLEKALRLLMLTPEQAKAAKGLHKYCSGRIKWMSSANLIDESRRLEKEQLLEQSLFDLKQSLAIHKKVYGDHTLTARTLNFIGNCYMEYGEPKEALKFYQQAMDMKIKLVGSEKHFDIPTYYNQLSQVYEIFGKEETSSETSWSFQSIANYIRSLISQEKRQNYDKTVEYLEKALTLQEEMGVNDTVDTATFQTNLANILLGLGKYDKALEYAQKSFKIRNSHLGEHPETVRILYLIGVIHEWRKDHKAALQSYEEAFLMEESLPEDNRSIVRKLICERLEAMCKKLKKEDKLKDYEPRMDKIRKVCLVRPTILDDIPSYNRPDQTDNVYKMTNYPRGVAIIANIEHFDIDPDHAMYGKLEDRVGSKKDEEDITRLFLHLSFIVKTIEKTAANDLLAELHRISTDYDFSTYDCFVFCIMSHGTESCIFASDGQQLTSSLIVSLFRKCKSLAGKPKLFFFQACRGEKADGGVIPVGAQADGIHVRASTDSVQPIDAHAVPVTADILEFYSSYIGYTSTRYPERGSLFIQSIVEVFREHACHKHILDLITMVKRIVSEKRQGYYMQMPEHKDTLRKLLYFWPGIYFQDDSSYLN